LDSGKVKKLLYTETGERQRLTSGPD